MNYRLIDEEEISFLHNPRLFDEIFFSDPIKFINFSAIQTNSHKQEVKEQQHDPNQLKSSLPLTADQEQMEEQDQNRNEMDVAFCWDFIQNVKEQILFTDHIPTTQQTIPPLYPVIQIEQDIIFRQFLSQSKILDQIQINSISQSQLQNNQSSQNWQPSFIDSQNSSCPSKKLGNQAKSGKACRKGKKVQSKTQKFIKFMTCFYFNKNFNQYFNKKLKDYQITAEVYQSFRADEKMRVIDSVIESLELYEMRIHYSVKNGTFLKGFSELEKKYIEELFWRVVRRAYQIKLQTNKRRLLAQQNFIQNDQDNKFLDREGQEQFEKAFDEMLYSHPSYDSLLNCCFEERLWRQFSK